MNDIGIASQKEKCKKHERLEHSLLSLCPNGGVERSPRNAEPLKAGQSEVDIRSNDLLGIFVSNSIIIEFDPVLLS